MRRALGATVVALAFGFTALLGPDADAQTRANDEPLIGRWTSTMTDTDRDVSPPVKFEETVTLTISSNGNMHLERLTRPLKSRNADLWVANGVYSVPLPGILKLTFNPEVKLEAAVWQYKVVGGKLTIVDPETNVSRTFARILF